MCGLVLPHYCWARARFIYSFSDGLAIWPCLYQLSVSEFHCRGISLLLKPMLFPFLLAEITRVNFAVLKAPWAWLMDLIDGQFPTPPQWVPQSVFCYCQCIQANYLIKDCGTCGEVAHHGRECARIVYLMAPRKERKGERNPYTSIKVKKKSPVILNFLLGLNFSGFYLTKLGCFTT